MKNFKVSYRGEESILIEANSYEDAYRKFLLRSDHPKQESLRIVDTTYEREADGLKIFVPPHDSGKLQKKGSNVSESPKVDIQSQQQGSSNPHTKDSPNPNATKPKPDSDTDSDTDADTDSDTDADTDPDTDPDTDSNIVQPTPSLWSKTFKWIGWILIVAGLVCAQQGMEAYGDKQQLLTTCAIIGLVAGVHSLFFGFIVNVFTDIRWYLQKMANKDS